MINEDISKEDLLKVFRAKRRRPRPVQVDSVEATPDPTPEANPPAKPPTKTEPKVDK